MNNQAFLKWLKINGLCFLAAFLAAYVLVQLLPSVMLGFWGAWASLMQQTGVKGAAAFTSSFNTFVEIFIRNSIAVTIVFFGSLFLAGPIMMVMYGFFYALVAGLAPATGVNFTWSGWALNAIEALFMLTAATFASTLATQVFGVVPERKPLLEFWKTQFMDWKNLWSFPEQERNWRMVFNENRNGFVRFIVVILALLLFGAWFETWGP